MKYFEVTFDIAVSEERLQDARDITSALAGEAGFESFSETPQGLTGYVQQTCFDRELLDELLAAMPMQDVSVTYTVAPAPDEDWNATWEAEGFSPIVMGHQCVVHDGRHLPAEPLSAWPVAIEIDARQAFGTGTHETTRMVAQALLGIDMQGCRVLDCGTGTGILSILALKCGARQAVAYDIDEWSADNARHNAIINGVDDRLDVLLGSGDLLDDKGLPAGTEPDGDAITGVFQVAVANINRNILLADMTRVSSHLAPQGLLVISGFYQADVPMLTSKAATLGLTLQQTLTDGDWACLVLQKKDQQTTT